MEEIEVLVVRAQQGDINAFGELVRQLQDMAVGYAYAILGDFGLAEDAAQEAFVKAFLDLPSLREPRAFAAWLRRITFTCCHAMRRRKRPAAMSVDMIELPSPEKGPMEQVQQREMRDAVLKAIQSLPPGERAVTTLFHINGYSQEQIGGFLGVPIGTVKTRLRRARSRLQERMLHMVDKTLKDNAPDEQFSKAILARLPQLPDMSKPVARLPDRLDAFQAKLILSAMPKGTQIVQLKPGAWIYRYPLVVHCRLPDGQETPVELHVHADSSTQREAQLLPVLAELGLPVQQVLAGPTVHPEYPEVGPMIVLSHLPGKNLVWLRKSPEEIDLSCRLLIEGLRRVRQLTEPLRRHAIGKALQRRTLTAEFDEIVQRGGSWMEQPLFRDAVARLRPALEAVAVPLVFSAGVLQQNFLCDGQNLTGFQWFAGACFADPHVDFAKYKYWAIDSVGWGLYDRAGLVERYLYDQDVSKSQFAPRLALRCLRRLQDAIPVEGGPRAEPRPDEDKSWDRERASCLSFLESSLSLIE